MELSNIRPAAGSNDTKFRRGRGHASGNGKTAGFGHKGQKARSGRPRAGFEGGQMPLYRRLPKRGFKNYNKKNIVTVDVTKLEKFENGAVVDIQALLDAGIISDVYDGVKVIGNGELTKKLTVKAKKFSASAKEKIEKAGGSALEV